MSFTVRNVLCKLSERREKKDCLLAMKTSRQQIETTEKVIKRTKIIIKTVN